MDRERTNLRFKIFMSNELNSLRLPNYIMEHVSAVNKGKVVID